MMNYNITEMAIYNGIRNYVDHRIPPGSFLEAVLCNDLKTACAQADHINRHALFEIVSYLYNEVPYDCWGSVENYRAWLKRTGAEDE